MSAPERRRRHPPADVTPLTEAGDRRSVISPSIIGSTLVMKGELRLDEDLIIDGTFDGELIDGAHRLTIGPFARVSARIRSESVDIAGVVEGDCEGSGTVVVRRTARIKGSVSASRLRVEDGTNLENTVLSGRISRAEGEHG